LKSKPLISKKRRLLKAYKFAKFLLLQRALVSGKEQGRQADKAGRLTRQAG